MTSSHPLILASASPRRRALLEQVGLSVRVLPVGIDETPLPGECPEDYVVRLARSKAQAGWDQAADTGAVVLGSDTSVVLAGQILGKPETRDDARGMLERLSGQCHEVMTGVAVATGESVQACLSVTRVCFRTLSDAEIEAYLATDEPWDKAGAYGIQGRAGIFVARLEGSYSGVVGLPLEATAALLEASGIPVWKQW